jgi:sugar (pentulose or hexulose) kinase
MMTVEAGEMTEEVTSPIRRETFHHHLLNSARIVVVVSETNPLTKERALTKDFLVLQVKEEVATEAEVQVTTSLMEVAATETSTEMIIEAVSMTEEALVTEAVEVSEVAEAALEEAEAASEEV